MPKEVVIGILKPTHTLDCKPMLNSKTGEQCMVYRKPSDTAVGKVVFLEGKAIGVMTYVGTYDNEAVRFAKDLFQTLASLTEPDHREPGMASLFGQRYGKAEVKVVEIHGRDGHGSQEEVSILVGNENVSISVTADKDGQDVTVWRNR
jgi:hypothetical protein